MRRLGREGEQSSESEEESNKFLALVSALDLAGHVVLVGRFSLFARIVNQPALNRRQRIASSNTYLMAKNLFEIPKEAVCRSLARFCSRGCLRPCYVGPVSHCQAIG